MPIFLIVLFGIIAFGIYFIAAQSIQHAVNEAARASVAGITPAERDQLARRKLDEVMESLPLVRADAMSVSTSEAGGNPPSFEVDINYDASHLGLPTVAHIIGLDLHMIERRATVQYGGF
ncbi:pilus assembly protein [Stappia sp. F7233]|uniref:Pilus assembly protein n=2 Tax=Stappia albiluteola TaxID=2758565 RepID=A0A839AGL3_9HYPH|nr:pilus assembly protein [Stappia albiluteola]